MEIDEHQQEEHNVQDTQMSSASPPQDTSATAEIIIAKDVSDASS